MNWNLRPALVSLALVAVLSCFAAAVAAAPVMFAPRTDYAVGYNGYPSAIADLDGDGDLDVVQPDASGGILTVLLNDGHGAFTHGTTVTGVTSSISVALGDLDGDGRTDLVTSAFAGWLEVRPGNGDGTFGAPIVLTPGGGGGGRVEIADMNGDGRRDLVTGSDGNVVSVLLGLGGFTFGPHLDAVTGYSPRWISVGDLNGDGRLDVVAPDRWEDRLTVLVGNGDGTFGARHDYGTGYWPYSSTIADFDRDGRPDVACSDHYPVATISYYKGNGDGTLGPRTVVPMPGGGLNGIVSADYDLDGRPDIAIAMTGDQVGVLAGDGAGGFVPPEVFHAADQVTYLATGDLNADGRPDLAVSSNSYLTSILLNATGTTIAPQSPATCITPEHACVEVPVTIANRLDATPLRGFSVTVRLSAELVLCGAGITPGSYLSSPGGTHFEVLDNHDGTWTVDGAILGLPCGATAPAGTLFTLHLGSSLPSGIGTVSVAGVLLRDCHNGPVTGWPGPPVAVTIDNATPTAVTLTAAQRTSGNDADGTTMIDVSWTGTVTPGDSVLVYRAPWGNYPEYDDVGGGVPAVPAYPPAAPWVKAAVVTAGVTVADEPPARDYWYYVAFVKDPCGNLGPVSNRTGGTLDYHLGDVSDGHIECSGNNSVYVEDISLLGMHYGALLPTGDPFGCLDVGPTTTGWVDGRPTTDSRVNFEDLMMYASNYLVVSAHAGAQAVASGVDELRLDAPTQVSAGEVFSASLRLRSSGFAQGLHGTLAWPDGAVELLRVESGELAQAQGGVVFGTSEGSVDAVVLGTGRTFAGEGELARVTFRALRGGTPGVTLASIEARDARNRPLSPTGVTPTVTATTALAAPAPNPFKGTATIAWSLARAGHAELAVFSVDGRRVATLARGTFGPGAHVGSWDGRDASGQPARPGVYFARLSTDDGRFTRTMVRAR